MSRAWKRRLGGVALSGLLVFLAFAAAGCGGGGGGSGSSAEQISGLGTNLDDEAASGGTIETGRIRDVVYVGMFTRYVVELDTGGELTAVKQNLESSSQDTLDEAGRRVRLEWRPEHTYELEPGGEA